MLAMIAIFMCIVYGISVSTDKMQKKCMDSIHEEYIHVGLYAHRKEKKPVYITH